MPPLLEQEIWIAQFAEMLRVERPTFDSKISADIGEFVWPGAREMLPIDGVNRFLVLLDAASKELEDRARARGPDRDL